MSQDPVINDASDNLPPQNSLATCRVIGLLNNTEVFGQERANIEVFKSLRRLAAPIKIGINQLHDGGQIRKALEPLEFKLFSLPFGCHWSKKFFRSEPYLLPKNMHCVYACCRELARQVRQFDATHLLLGNPLVYSFIAPYLWWNKKLTVIYRMGDEPPYQSRPNLMIWKQCMARANLVVANSEFVRNSILAACGAAESKLKLIYNVAPGDDLQLENTQPASSSQLRVLYVGQISEHKGVHHFVDSAIALAKLNRQWQFDVVGGSFFSTALESALRAKILDNQLQDRIVLHGRQDDPSHFYGQALMIVVPSLFEEPAANVVLEAKRQGVPAIVYPSGGLPELVSDQKTGFICASKDQAVLQQQMLDCLTDPQRCRSMREECQTEYQTRFRMDRFDRQWCQVFRATTNSLLAP